MALFQFPRWRAHPNTTHARAQLQWAATSCWYLHPQIYDGHFFLFFFFFAHTEFTLNAPQPWWCFAWSQSNSDLLISEACNFNARVMNQALTVQSVVLLMEIIRNAGMHEQRAPIWIFLKILNYLWDSQGVANQFTAPAARHADALMRWS